MSSSPVLRGDLHGSGGTQRVVLRSQPHAAPAEPAQPGVWITEQELAGLKRQWMDQAREQGQRDAQEAATRQAQADAQAGLARELKARDEKHAKDQTEKWRGLATALAGQLKSLREQVEAEVSEWTFIAATRLLGERTRDGAVSAVKHVLAEARLDDPVTLLLDARDVALIEAAREADPTGWPAELTFAASDRLPLGGCLVQSPIQTLDARLDVQLALLREALNLARHERQGDGN